MLMLPIDLIALTAAVVAAAVVAAADVVAAIAPSPNWTLSAQRATELN